MTAQKLAGVAKWLGAASAIVALVLALSAASRAFGVQAEAVNSIRADVEKLDQRKADRALVEALLDQNKAEHAEIKATLRDVLNAVQSSRRTR